MVFQEVRPVKLACLANPLDSQQWKLYNGLCVK